MSFNPKAARDLGLTIPNKPLALTDDLFIGNESVTSPLGPTEKVEPGTYASAADGLASVDAKIANTFRLLGCFERGADVGGMRAPDPMLISRPPSARCAGTSASVDY